MAAFIWRTSRLLEDSTDFVPKSVESGAEAIAVWIDFDELSTGGSMGIAAEENLSRSLRSILGRVENGAQIEDSKPFRDVLCRLESFVDAWIGEVHPEWNLDESLDGILPYVARKTGEREAEIIGHCILITDQTTTPIHIRLQLAREVDEVSWLELKLGEKGENGMVRRPYSNPPSLRRVAALADGIDAIDWVYKVGFGERRTGNES